MAFVDRLIGFVSPAAALRRAQDLTDAGRFAEAFPLLAAAARGNLPEAELRIAMAYLEGAGVPASRAEGVRWLRAAAEHEQVEAQALLGALCLRGLADASAGGLFADDSEPGAPDFAAALKWGYRAAEGGSGKGQALRRRHPDAGSVLDARSRCRAPMVLAIERVGLRRRRARLRAVAGAARERLSRRCSGDPRENRRAAAKGVDAGLPTATYLLAEATERGTGVAADRKAALKLYRQAAEQGHRAAQVRWGQALIEGRDLERDAVTGKSWLRRAAMAGDVEAAKLIGDFYSRGGGSPANYAEAATWYRRAAETGHQAAARALGSLYLTGAGVPQDDGEAVRWLRVAADAGDASSQVNLANLVARGAGDGDDPARIVAWFGRAAEAGDQIAGFNLGLCLAKGIGVERDDAQAALWLRWAAEGVAEAQYMLGGMLVEGRGVAVDLFRARNWFQRAAEAGITDAKVALGEMLLNGRGGQRDASAALDLVRAGGSKGHSGAMFALGAIHGGGHGFAADRALAQRWFQAAAEMGHGEAQLMLGKYLARGAAGRLTFRGRESGWSRRQIRTSPARTMSWRSLRRQGERRRHRHALAAKAMTTQKLTPPAARRRSPCRRWATRRA